MTVTATKPQTSHPTITRRPPSGPVFAATGLAALIVKAGTALLHGDITAEFDADTVIAVPESFKIGQDYEIVLTAEGSLVARQCGLAQGDGQPVFGGFCHAPGGNAEARAGGSGTPAINPFSIWDAGYRPACPDPRGMVLVTGEGLAPFWADIYLTNRNHPVAGTSRHGAVIADGHGGEPDKPGGGSYDNLNYETAQAIAAHHGKRLMSFFEFATAAYGVTEKSADTGKEKLTGLSAARTSKFGLMQATGQRWVWGHDGDPDEPRASLFGGSWFDGSNAGSRCAYLDDWPGHSNAGVGLRLASDHLTTV